MSPEHPQHTQSETRKSAVSSFVNCLRGLFSRRSTWVDSIKSEERDLVSPFPWISDEVWGVWNRYESPAGSWDDISPINAPRLNIVFENDRQRAPIVAVASNLQIPPEGTLEQHRALLDSTRGGGYIGWVRWPICCRRLCTLIMAGGGRNRLESIEANTGPLDQVLLLDHAADEPGSWDAILHNWADQLRQIRIGKHGGDGVNLFQCRNCGRVYGAYSEP